MNKKRYTLSHIALGVLCVVFASACSHPITRKLFEQSGRSRIFHPTASEEKSAVLSEQVSYKTTIDTIRKESSSSTNTSDNDGLKSVELSTLTVTADRPQIKISTVRNGKINLSFLTKLPKAFMDDRWEVVLSPRLLNGDSTIQLPKIVLQGKDFRAKQDMEYANFDKFKASIVEHSRYDSVFFDHKKHRSLHYRIQEQYYKNYLREYRKYLSYEKWLHKLEKRYMGYNARLDGRYLQSVNNKGIEMLYKEYITDLYGGDSVAIRSEFYNKYTSERQDSTMKSKHLDITRRNVPIAYRRIFDRKLTLDSLQNKSFTDRDSLDISRHSYKFKEIAKNESKVKNMDVHKRHIINFPRIESPALLQEIKSGEEFVYLYSQDIEVTEALQRKLSIVLDTRITAIDRSTWMQKGLDTLNYVISGMNDLVDADLINRLDSNPEAKAEYQKGLERLAVRDYRGALGFLGRYPDYNSALSLAALGENDKALKVLDYLTPNPKINYLRAIIYVRQKRLDEAKKTLIASARGNNLLAFRAETDPEFANLLVDSIFKQQLIDIGEGLDQ